MRGPALLVLLVSLCAQATFGQIEIEAEGLRQVDHNRGQDHLGLVGEPGDALNKVGEVAEENYPSAGYTDLGSTGIPKGERPQSIAAPLVQAEGRNLQSSEFCISFDATISQCTATLLVQELRLVVVDITGAELAQLSFPSVELESGVAADLTADVFDMALLNDDKNGFCDGCALKLANIFTNCLSNDVAISDVMVENKVPICVIFEMTASQCTVTTTVTELTMLVFDAQGDQLGQLVINSVEFVGGTAMVTAEVFDVLLLNPAADGFCVGCVFALGVFLPGCTSTSIELSSVVVDLKEDPHMVGLLGQKIDWAGEDNAWYCVLSDGPDFQINVRLSAPMPEEFPDRQLVSAISLLSGEGHSLVIEVKDPYSTETDGCPDALSVPCLADGGVRILVDEAVPSTMQTTGERTRLPGGVVVSAANLQPECRPFGGDRIWAEQFEQMMNARRSLRTSSPTLSFSDWILHGATLAAPTWCAKLLEEGGAAGLLSGHSNHVIARVEMPAVTVRVNVGVNYQDEVTGPDGTVVVPELEFWQIDLGFERFGYSDNITGLMGDTSRFVLDDEGLPVTAGLGALHAPVESYRVDGPLGRDFKKMHQ